VKLLPVARAPQASRSSDEASTYDEGRAASRVPTSESGELRMH
jgi:hypothetical protein